MLEDQMPDLDNELVQKVCGVIDVNAFEIRIPMAIIRAHSPNPFINSHDSLKGAFYEAALMNHSCVPNAQIAIGTDQVMSVIAQVPIKEDEPVVISYTDPLQTTLYRRNFLLNGKYFVCKCKRCEDPTELGTFLSAIKCLKCPNGAVLPRSESDKLRWACGVCSQEMAEDAAVRMEEVVQNIVRNIQQLPIDRYLMDRCEDLFLTLPKKLHSNHALLMQLRVHLMQLYGNVPGFLIPEMSPVLLKRKANLCYEVLEVLRKICPGYSRIRGVALYDFHQPLVILASKKFENGNTKITQLIKDLRDAEAVLKEAVDILVLEPVSSPEATICRAAMNDLKQLRDYIREMEELKKSGVVG